MQHPSDLYEHREISADPIAAAPMLNQPLPPTPQPRTPMSPADFFAAPAQPPSPPQTSQQNASSSDNTTRQPQSPMLSQNDAHDSIIVGPSDHYGFYGYHGFANDENSASHGISSDQYQRRPAASNAHQLIARPSIPQDETKVLVIVDSRTPVMFKIPVSPANITLADLKATVPAIDQPGYKYFFKTNDSEFGIVKEEIPYDDRHLPMFRNRVVAWIVTPNQMGDELSSKTKSESGTCNMTYTNTSYLEGSSSFMTTDMETSSYLTETEDDSVSCGYSETTCDTFLSQARNNKHYGSGISHSKSPDSYHNRKNHSNHYHNHYSHQSPTPYRHGASQNNRSAMDNLCPSSSPTSSSASFSDATAVHCVTVHLVLTNENFLGLHIYANKVDGVDEGIYVDGVTANSAIALDGRIEPGDKLIQVNDTNLEEISNDQAVKVLKEAVAKRGPLKLVVAKYEDKNDTVDGILNPREAVHPIDTAAWVAHAHAITMPQSNPDHANSATSSPSFGSNAHDTDCIRPASAGIARLNSSLRLNRGTSDIKEIIHHMKLPEVGLEIRNREWLKIQIPSAFLGSELISWLERHVYGFINSRDAKKFASRMLKEGHIRDPISKKSFSSKSYYVFAA